MSDRIDYAAYRILLTQGLTARVDLVDYKSLSRFKWYATKNGSKFYARRWDGSTKRDVGMHDQILKKPYGLIVDHINGNTLDNRRSNLRLTDHAGNSANSPGRKRSSTGYRGVSKNGDGTFYARLKHGSKTSYLGRFDDPIEAALAYDEEAVEIWGDMATTNARLGLV